jgi:hypothetical protein
MENKEGDLDKLRVVYDNLDDTEKGKVVRLAEGLLKSQNNNIEENKSGK